MEWKLYTGEPPHFTTPEWYAQWPRTPHLEQPDHRGRIIHSAKVIRDIATRCNLHTVVDLGCGDGGLLSLLDRLDTWGYDITESNVTAANHDRHVDVDWLDVVAHPDDVDWAEIAVATEFFEHLADPHAYVREIAKHCDALVCSSPANENDTTHYDAHAWAWDMPGYAALITQGGFTVISHDLVTNYQVIGAVRR